VEKHSTKAILWQSKEMMAVATCRGTASRIRMACRGPEKVKMCKAATCVKVAALQLALLDSFDPSD